MWPPLRRNVPPNGRVGRRLGGVPKPAVSCHDVDVNLRSSRLRRLARTVGGAGLILLVVSACTDPPTREQTSDSALFEITSDQTARVTLRANRPTFLSNEPVARSGRRADSTATSAPTSTRPLTSAELGAGLKAFLHASEHPSTELTRPRVTVAALGRVLAADATVTRVRARPDLVVADLRFSRLASSLQFKPATVVRTLARGGMRNGTIWVGVCTAASRGEWVTSTDAFDHQRGCASWVPTANATSVGVLRHRSSVPAETWWIALLVAFTGLLLVSCVVRAIARPFERIPKLSLVPPVVFVVSIASGAALVWTAGVTRHVHEIFGTTIESATHDVAVGTAWLAACLAACAFAATVWTLQPKGRARLRRVGAGLGLG